MDAGVGVDDCASLVDPSMELEGASKQHSGLGTDGKVEDRKEEVAFPYDVVGDCGEGPCPQEVEAASICP